MSNQLSMDQISTGVELDISNSGVTLEESSQSANESGYDAVDEEPIEDQTHQRKPRLSNQVQISQTDLQKTLFNHDFRTKLKEPTQNCCMRSSLRCCCTLWIWGNLFCLMQIALALVSIIRGEYRRLDITERSFATRWGIISTCAAIMAIYGLHRCVPECILLYIGAMVTAVATYVLDTIVDSFHEKEFQLMKATMAGSLVVIGFWTAIVFYRIYLWANYFRYVRGGYDPQMRFPLFL